MPSTRSQLSYRPSSPNAPPLPSSLRLARESHIALPSNDGGKSAGNDAKQNPPVADRTESPVSTSGGHTPRSKDNTGASDRVAVEMNGNESSKGSLKKTEGENSDEGSSAHNDKKEENEIHDGEHELEFKRKQGDFASRDDDQNSSEIDSKKPAGDDDEDHDGVPGDNSKRSEPATLAEHSRRRLNSDNVIAEVNTSSLDAKPDDDDETGSDDDDDGDNDNDNSEPFEDDVAISSDGEKDGDDRGVKNKESDEQVERGTMSQTTDSEDNVKLF